MLRGVTEWSDDDLGGKASSLLSVGAQALATAKLVIAASAASDAGGSKASGSAPGPMHGSASADAELPSWSSLLDDVADSASLGASPRTHDKENAGATKEATEAELRRAARISSLWNESTSANRRHARDTHSGGASKAATAATQGSGTRRAHGAASEVYMQLGTGTHVRFSDLGTVTACGLVGCWKMVFVSLIVATAPVAAGGVSDSGASQSVAMALRRLKEAKEAGGASDSPSVASHQSVLRTIGTGCRCHRALPRTCGESRCVAFACSDAGHAQLSEDAVRPRDAVLQQQPREYTRAAGAVRTATNRSCDRVLPADIRDCPPARHS